MGIWKDVEIKITVYVVIQFLKGKFRLHISTAQFLFLVTLFSSHCTSLSELPTILTAPNPYKWVAYIFTHHTC